MAIPVGEYIFRRLHSLGIKHIFGVPGDFNLNLLDYIDSVDGLEYIGNRNELNGAYAADGYARSRGLPGVVVTTFGVGELSAINGIAGSYSEYVPVIHIAGMTSRAVQKARLMIHHTLGQGDDHRTYMGLSKPVSAGSAILDDDATFTREVDRVIELCFKKKLPVYLYVPMDVPDILVDSSRLDTPLDLEITNEGQATLEDSLVEEILTAISRAKRPSLLVDLLTRRFGLTREVGEIAELAGLPVSPHLPPLASNQGV
jgi:pyruvate decarboxylase